MPKGSLLLIDDNQDFLDTMSFELQEYGLKLFTCSSLEEVQLLNKRLHHLNYVVIDLRIGNDSGLDIIPIIRKDYPKARITMLTAFGSIASTVEAMKRGSDNYIMKPCSTQEILVALGIELESPPQDRIQEKTEQTTEIPDLYRKEREYIDYVLQMKNGNISHTAQALGIKRQSLQRKLRKFIPKNG